MATVGFVISFLINHKTGSRHIGCMPFLIKIFKDFNRGSI